MPSNCEDVDTDTKLYQKLCFSAAAAPASSLSCMLQAKAMQLTRTTQSQMSLTSGPTEEEVKDMLKDTIVFAEEEEARAKQDAEDRKNLTSYYTRWIKTCNKHDIETALDSLMGVVICANAIFIGFSMDNTDKSLGWMAMDIGFSAAFLLELLAKVGLKGFRGQYCSGSKVVVVGVSGLTLRVGR